MKKPKKSLTTRVDYGKVAEYRLAAEVLALGGIPCWPSTAEVPYDMIVDTGSKRIKVQVKGTGQVGKASVRLKKGSGRYVTGDFDVLAIWIRPSNAWYLFPIASILGASYVAIDEEKGKNTLLQFKNNWSILGL